MKAKVKEVKRLNSEACIVYLESEKRPGHKPGQFVHVMYRDEDDNPHVKPYSLANHPNHPQLEICIKNVGTVSNYLCSRSPGDEVELLGPKGVFVLDKESENDIVFMASGTGISSIRPMILEALGSLPNKNLYLFYSTRTEDVMAYREEFERLSSNNDNFTFIPIVTRSKDWDGESERTQHIIEDHVENPENKDYYICGVPEMVTDCKDKCEELKVPGDQIHEEVYV